MGILTKIRQRPDNEKRLFSLVSAGVLTLIIFIVWLGFTTSASNTQVENPDKLSSLSPMQVIKDEFSKAFANFNNFKQEMSVGSSTSDSISSSTIPIEIMESTSTATSTASTTNQ